MMDKATSEHYNLLLCVIKYVMDMKTKVLGLPSEEMERELEWWLLPYSNSD